MHVGAEPERGDALLEPRPQHAVADNDPGHAPALVDQPGEGVEHQLGILRGVEPADGDDARHVGLEREPAAPERTQREPLGVGRGREHLVVDPGRAEADMVAERRVALLQRRHAGLVDAPGARQPRRGVRLDAAVQARRVLPQHVGARRFGDHLRVLMEDRVLRPAVAREQQRRLDAVEVEDVEIARQLGASACHRGGVAQRQRHAPALAGRFDADGGKEAIEV